MYNEGSVLSPDDFTMTRKYAQNGCSMSLPSISRQQMEYLFTCLISQATKHVNKFKENRVAKSFNPTPSELVGEFSTVIRRLKKDVFPDLHDMTSIGRVDFWDGVGIPSRKSYLIPFTVYTLEGTHRFTLDQVQYLCEMAVKMNTKTSDDEFKEISANLDDLLKQTTGLDIIISRARDLNSQANECVTKLCLIADDLTK